MLLESERIERCLFEAFKESIPQEAVLDESKAAPDLADTVWLQYGSWHRPCPCLRFSSLLPTSKSSGMHCRSMIIHGFFRSTAKRESRPTGGVEKTIEKSLPMRYPISNEASPGAAEERIP